MAEEEYEHEKLDYGVEKRKCVIGDKLLYGCSNRSVT
jgi:hypothetical protein